MAGLELVGSIAATRPLEGGERLPAGDAPPPVCVVGDARALGAYSGCELGARWIVRVFGPLVDTVPDWPGGLTFAYLSAPEEARAHYAALRGHLLHTAPELTLLDLRTRVALNVPEAQAEVALRDGAEVARLVLDRIADIQMLAIAATPVLRFPAHAASPEGPQLGACFAAGGTVHLAVGRAPSGAAEHVCLVSSARHDVAALAAGGFAGAVRDEALTTEPFELASGIAVVASGSLCGRDLLATARGRDPAELLHEHLGARLAAPLADPFGDASAPSAPLAYAVRVEPGPYVLAHHALRSADGDDVSIGALSRLGAPSFQPRRHEARRLAGLRLEQYAWMTVEREAILAREGLAAGPDLAALCERWGQPVPRTASGAVDMKRAGRVAAWDLAVQEDPSLAEEWARLLKTARGGAGA